MSTAADEEQHDEQEQPEHRTGRVVRFGWGLYQQIAAVFAAIGLAALAEHWWHIGWRGSLASLVGVWEQTVRPAMTAVLHALLTVPLGWVHIHFETPLLVRDYLSVGLVLALSNAREVRRIQRDPFKFGRKRDLDPGAQLMMAAAVIPYWLLFLPVYLYTVPVDVMRLMLHAKSRTPERISDLAESVRTLAPLLYLGILLALNYWVLS